MVLRQGAELAALANQQNRTVRLSLAARRHAARPDTEAKGDAHATEAYEGKALASLAILATPPPARLQRPAKAHRAPKRGSREALGCLPMRVGACRVRQRTADQRQGEHSYGTFRRHQ